MGEYQTLVPDELQLALAENAIAYLPLGSVEWHNVHLPFNTDSLIGEKLCQRLAEKTGGLVLPVNPWANACTFTRRGPYQFEPAIGTIALFDDDLYQRLFRAIMREIVENGFKRIVVVAGHTGIEDRRATQKVVEEVNAENQARVLFLHPYQASPIDHAGHHETLMMLGLYPDLVRQGKRYIEFKYGRPLTGGESVEEGRRKVEEIVMDLHQKILNFFQPV